MTPGTRTFETPEPALADILRDVASGKLQLPDFQRDWIWNDEHIKSLIASVTRSFPIGAIMVLENEDGESGFLTRGVEGAKFPANVKPKELILDGQQRITSLFLALSCKDPVSTRNEEQQDIKRFYYLDMRKCLDPELDREEAVISIPESRKITSDFGRKVELDLSSPELEYQQCLLPANIVFDLAGLVEWKNAFQSYYRFDPAMIKLLNDFDQRIWLPLYQYRLPEIRLPSDTEREAVCLVFEKVNTGGVPLDVFELMTATYARDQFRLRQDWLDLTERLDTKVVLQEFDETAYLTAITLLAKYNDKIEKDTPVSCRRKDVLKLPLASYKKYAPQIEAGLFKAANLLTRERIYDVRSLPYATQLIPLSAICAYLDKRFDNDAVKQKLSRWLWCGIFGELYGGASETRYAQDMSGVIAWINGGPEPKTVEDCNFSTTRFLTLQNRLSAAYKGLMALLMKRGNADFITGDQIDVQNYFEQNIDIHHIFPRAYCEKRKLPKIKWNCVINKAPLSAITNRKLGGKAPSHYLRYLRSDEHILEDRLEKFLLSHQVNPALLAADNFGDFIIDRAARLLDLIEEATGKQVSDRESDEVQEKFGRCIAIEPFAALGISI